MKIHMFKHPKLIAIKLLDKTGIKRMSEKEYLEWTYAQRNRGGTLNIRKPVTYTDKLNWLKLYDRNPVYTTMVDKVAVKKYVADIIGKEYVIPTIGVYKQCKEIIIDDLPESFVLKCTHDSGLVFICKNKNTFDFTEAFTKLDERLKIDYSDLGIEWPYKNVPRRIICEQYIDGISDNNYKFFCFSGKVRAVYIAPYREQTVDYFDENYNHLEIITRLHQNADTPPEKPALFDEMKRLAEKISFGYPHMRVDFYETNGTIYFGEITFFNEGGFVPFIPDKFNYIFGDWIELPDKK